MRWIKTLLWMVVFFFAIHFSIQNKEGVTLHYSIQNMKWIEISNVPLFLIILVSIFLGVLIGGIADLYGRLRLKKILRQNQKIVERLEREIQSLRESRFDQTPFFKKEDSLL